VRLPNGRTLTIQVKKSYRAKRLCLKANIFGIHVVVPMIKAVPMIEVMKFLDIKKDGFYKSQNTMRDYVINTAKRI
jgi:predicted metal-dependent hydrolase